MLLAATVAAIGPAPAETLWPAAARRISIANDPGGAVEDYARRVAALRDSAVEVRITGGCWSACTLYLALPQTCVTRTARLGFHGPSSRYPGIPLPQPAFDTISRRMAAHYPEPLRGWYLAKGRFRTRGFTEFTGAELIRMGVPRCAG